MGLKLNSVCVESSDSVIGLDSETGFHLLTFSRVIEMASAIAFSSKILLSFELQKCLKDSMVSSVDLLQNVRPIGLTESTKRQMKADTRAGRLVNMTCLDFPDSPASLRTTDIPKLSKRSGWALRIASAFWASDPEFRSLPRLNRLSLVWVIRWNMWKTGRNALKQFCTIPREKQLVFTIWHLLLLVVHSISC